MSEASVRCLGHALSKSTLDAVLCEVTAETGISPGELRSASRSFPIAHARQYAMWKLRRMTSGGVSRYSLIEIGRAFNRDHTTVIHALRAHERRSAEKGAQ